jgi:hypothetical protein
LSALSDTSKLEAAIQRITATALTDDGYRAQLVTLADRHGGIYRHALDALYESEGESLGEEQASERAASDGRRLELEQAGTLVRAIESSTRAMRERQRVKLVSLAREDEALRDRLVALANKQGGIYAEALEEFGR